MQCTLPNHPTLSHPISGEPLRALGIRRDGTTIWPILGGSEPPEPPTYTPPASQADLDKLVESRLARERAKYADYDDLKTKAARVDALENDLSSESEKAVKKARDDARAEALAEANPRAVRAEFKAAAKGVLTADQLTALLEDLDLSKYLTDKGDVDEEKIEKKVKAFGPAKDEKKPPPRALGQGTQPGVAPKPGDAGRAAAQRMFGDKAKSAAKANA